MHQTINSVLSQTYKNFEVIVVDDGSTDNTQEVVRQIKDERLKYIYQDNAERSAARNNGIMRAKGQYICFLDSDDWYEPVHLETLYAEIQKQDNSKGLFFTHCFHFQNKVKHIPPIPLLQQNALDYLLNHPVIPGRVCVHTDILKEFKFREDIVIVEDQVLWVTIASKYPVFQIPIYTVVYHLHEDNSINIKNNCYKPRLDGLRKLFVQRNVTILIPSKTKRELISNCYYGIAKYYAFKQNYILMFSNVLKSILRNPFHVHTKAKIYLLLNPSKTIVDV